MVRIDAGRSPNGRPVTAEDDRYPRCSFFIGPARTNSERCPDERRITREVQSTEEQVVAGDSTEQEHTECETNTLQTVKPVSSTRSKHPMHRLE